MLRGSWKRSHRIHLHRSHIALCSSRSRLQRQKLKTVSNNNLQNIFKMKLIVEDIFAPVCLIKVQCYQKAKQKVSYDMFDLTDDNPEKIDVNIRNFSGDLTFNKATKSVVIASAINDSQMKICSTV